MADNFGDARLEELKILAELARPGGATKSFARGPWRDMAFFLIAEHFVNEPNIDWHPTSGPLSNGMPGDSALERHLHMNWVSSLSDSLSEVSVHLELSHRGRVRLSELKQAMTSGKIREQYGVLWDGRHLETDLEVAILDASQESLLTVGLLDMNGLKGINDAVGHEAGNLAVRAYFESVAAALADKGQAYRVGGDEVIAIMPCHDGAKARTTLQKACTLLMGEKLEFEGRILPRVSLSVGIATTADPRAKAAELRKRADVEMYPAKERTRGSEFRPSAIAATGSEVLVIPFDDQVT